MLEFENMGTMLGLIDDIMINCKFMLLALFEYYVVQMDFFLIHCLEHNEKLSLFRYNVFFLD